ncbi:vanadium-dependent haloperoxidase [Mastigocoleus sp. MO_188.B34]|uniref:vanadium-dependent haloperoxidase n=1 Tax=Mastigocoleus sp. MO_188.B34 TaxID=3036635 RepID=UPI002608587F|nr:vanadium-dependent haloperoxidase [Mastigocoleus sp. MO_188.B34]MDJ0694677.1 vanadium-dependent haloperoxidase [Mastigocoleus sp. MO_188.B34]
MTDRKFRAREIRRQAAEVAFERKHPEHISNGEEFKYRIVNEENNCKGEVTRKNNKPSHIANFTKGLPHDVNTGLLVSSDDYQQFVAGIDSGDVRDFKDTPLGPPGQDGERCPNWESQLAQSNKVSVRAWESQGAGLTFDLEGPDAQSVTMPPAPKLDSAELVTEMIENYSMALLRDCPFARFGESQTVERAIRLLNDSPWIKYPDTSSLSDAEQKRRRGPFCTQNVFRGITPGDDVGPYISQFLLIGNQPLGNGSDPSTDGFIRYGSVRIDQRVRTAKENLDFMTTWEAWVDVQNGADVRGLETYVDQNDPLAYRFLATPRDLATYVHYDALYEAYLNACLLMLEMKVPFDPGLPFRLPDHIDKQQGFAQFGGPHILSLVTEVATRALKAVRFQKFNVHRRLRPEAVGGLVHRFKDESRDNKGIEVIETLVQALDGELLAEVVKHNDLQNQNPDRSCDPSANMRSYLLPMAFPEGSPMHPSYGAGHATVAGACVTILKAFFDHSWELRDTNGNPYAYEASPNGSCLQSAIQTLKPQEALTVEGELNKLASNISIGRNWAGVHYFTDYIESIRLGEQIALGILEEQKLTYRENFSMTVPLFDGGTVRI